MPAVYSKPTTLPEWAPSGDIVEPAAGKKDVGWELNEVPPHAWENWRANNVYEWMQWIDERFFDGILPSPFGGTKSVLIAADLTACMEFTDQGPVVMTNAMSFASDLSSGVTTTATYFGFVADQLVDVNTGLFYDRVANEWVFKINDAVAQWVLDEDGRMRINNLSGSPPPAYPTLELLDRKGGDASGKRWDIYAKGDSNSLIFESFTQAGVSDGLQLQIDTSNPASVDWIFGRAGTPIFTLRPRVDLFGEIGSPSFRWSGIRVFDVREINPQYYYAEGSGANFPIIVAHNTTESIMPDKAIESNGISVALVGSDLRLSVTMDGMYKVDATIQMDNGLLVGTRLTFFLALNGVKVTDSEFNYATQTQGVSDFDSIAMSWIVPISSSDYLELICDNVSGGAVAGVQIEVLSKVTVTSVRKN